MLTDNVKLVKVCLWVLNNTTKSMKGDKCMIQNVEFDYKKLRLRIIEKVGSNGKMAELLGITETSFSRKMNNKVAFSTQDIFEMAEILEISADEIGAYFFVPKE